VSSLCAIELLLLDILARFVGGAVCVGVWHVGGFTILAHLERYYQPITFREQKGFLVGNTFKPCHDETRVELLATRMT
jgi:hypothetical protein